MSNHERALLAELGSDYRLLVKHQAPKGSGRYMIEKLRGHDGLGGAQWHMIVYDLSRGDHDDLITEVIIEFCSKIEHLNQELGRAKAEMAWSKKPSKGGDAHDLKSS